MVHTGWICSPHSGVGWGTLGVLRAGPGKEEGVGPEQGPSLWLSALSGAL